MFKRLHESEREAKKMSFISNVESLNWEYLDICEGVKWDLTVHIQFI